MVALATAACRDSKKSVRCEVNLWHAGFARRSGHADFHGAVGIPATAVNQLPEAIELVARREKIIVEMARSPSFNSVKMREALKRVNEIR